MPTLPVLRDEGGFRWDASSALISTIMVPDQLALRKEYEAALKLQTAEGFPDGKDLLTTRVRTQLGILISLRM